MVHIITGSNDFLRQKSINELIDSYAESGNSIERFDGLSVEFDELLNAVRNTSLFDDEKLVVLKHPAQNKSIMNNFEQIIGSTADSTTLIIDEPGFDKRSNLYKALKKHPGFKQFDDQNPEQLQRWIQEYVESLGASIKQQAVRELLDRVGSNQQLLANEIQKIVLHSDKITPQLVSEHTDATPQSKVFDLLDALFQGKTDRAWELYLDQRNQGEDPQRITAMLTWQLQQLTLAVYAPQKNEQTLRSVGVSPYSAQKLLRLAQNIDKQTLKQLIADLADADYHAKTDSDADNALEVYIASFAVSLS